MLVFYYFFSILVIFVHQIKLNLNVEMMKYFISVKVCFILGNILCWLTLITLVNDICVNHMTRISLADSDHHPERL